MGLWKMAAGSDLSYSSLRASARNYVRLETLRAGNDFISNALASLPMFHHYDIQDKSQLELACYENCTYVSSRSRTFWVITTLNFGGNNSGRSQRAPAAGS
jgi:hypothetical protein